MVAPDEIVVGSLDWSSRSSWIRLIRHLRIVVAHAARQVTRKSSGYGDCTALLVRQLAAFDGMLADSAGSESDVVHADRSCLSLTEISIH